MPLEDKDAPGSRRLHRSEPGTLRLRMDGDWMAGALPLSVGDVASALVALPTKRLVFDTRALGRWDSGLLTFLSGIKKNCGARGVFFDDAHLPDGVRRLLALAATPRRPPVHGDKSRSSFLERVVDGASAFWTGVVQMAAFLGELTCAFGRLATGRARFRPAELLVIMQECGVQALPIVSLISLLVGLILAFVGAVQLTMFGAGIYVASLVAIAIVRVMGAVMTGVLMAGRTGAAFAARLGTMQVNEEIDALVTLGVDPVGYLVLPRVVALVVMMPLLCLYADLMGILGGLLVGVFMLDLNVMEYWAMTQKAVRLQDFWIGLFHSAVFGVLVAMAGCMRGFQCGRSASAVGEAATAAVVTGIVSIVVATAVITVVCNVLGV